jgi:hypothetical protein
MHFSPREAPSARKFTQLLWRALTYNLAGSFQPASDGARVLRLRSNIKPDLFGGKPALRPTRSLHFSLGGQGFSPDMKSAK